MKILDVSAGNRAMWFDKNNPLTTFVDRRAEVNPNVVADSTQLRMFADSTFDLAVFDPPHVNVGANSIMSKAYGHSTSAQIRAIVEGTARELYRVLKDGSLMVFKWNDHDQKLAAMLSLMPQFEPLFGQVTAVRVRPDNRVRCSTYWVLLRSRKRSDAD